MSKNQQFQKFINVKSNAARKEQFKQEKRAAKREKAAAIEKRFEEKRRLQQARNEDRRPVDGRKPIVNSQQRIVGSQKSIVKSQQPSAKGQPPIVGSQKSVVKNQEPNAKGQQPVVGSQKSIVKSQQPNAKGQPPIVGSQKSPVKSQEPNAKGQQPTASPQPILPGQMPLNKFIAHSGVCSRRDAADLVKNGDVKVNQQVILEPGFKVTEADTVTVKGKTIRPTQNLVYILLNKPKDYITTLEDPQGRKTILELIRRATPERVYPVGRLDRNTSGVLLITNDGELAQTLSHPKNLVKKIYEVRLDKPLTKAHFEQMATGLQLEDGFIAPDAIGYADSKDKAIIGIEIHSGRNRIVRRMFEHLGYDVVNLDRVMYAGLTKKNVTRGKWRFLTEKEVRILRHFNPQTKTDRQKKNAKPSKPNTHGKRAERRD